MIRRLSLLILSVLAVMPLCAQFRYAPVVGADYSTLNFKQDQCQTGSAHRHKWRVYVSGYWFRP